MHLRFMKCSSCLGFFTFAPKDQKHSKNTLGLGLSLPPLGPLLHDPFLKYQIPIIPPRHTIKIITLRYTSIKYKI